MTILMHNVDENENFRILSENFQYLRLGQCQGPLIIQNIEKLKSQSRIAHRIIIEWFN